jgi:hypothetical protein
MIKKITFLLLMLMSSMGFSQELLTNGDFQTGDGTGWNSTEIVDLDVPNGDYAFQKEVTAVGAPHTVNLAQLLSLTTGITYELSFDAFTNTGNTRTMIAGIGQNGNGWMALTETPTLTDVSQTFTYQFTVNYASPESSRVLFDMGADAGFVTIDNVSLTEYVAPAGTDISLSDLTVDGSTIANFGANTSSYDVELAAGTTTVPTVAATPTDTNATAVVTDATSLPGATTILVTAQDGTTTNTVTINFTLNPDPAVNAPTPTNDGVDVISVYSDTFTGVTATWHPGWSQTTSHSEIQISGNNVAKLSSFGYEGLTYNSMDVSSMEKVHFDVYSVDETSIKFFLLADAEPFVQKDLTPGSWNSFDISLSEFSGATLSTNTGFKFESGTYSWPNGVSTIYIDNIYFWKEPTVAGTDTSLSDLTVDGSTIANFGANTSSYDVELATGTTTVPAVAAAPTDTNATVQVTDATSLPGATTILVTSQDGTANNTVTINFTVRPAAGDYCQTQVTHFNIEAETPSAVLLTIERVDANNVDVSISSANADPVDLLIIGAQEDPASAVSAMTLVDGTATIRLTYDNGAPDSTKFEILWSKESTPGNWMLRTADFSAPINTANSCNTASVGNVEAENVRVAPNPTTGLINVTGDIYNTSGQLVLKNSNDLSGLPSGLYFIKVIANGSVSTSKVIKR